MGKAFNKQFRHIYFITQVRDCFYPYTSLILKFISEEE